MAIKLGANFDKSKATKNLARGYKLVPHIDRWLPRWDETGFSFESKQKEPDTAWHPSGHCTPSLNELYHYALAHPTKETYQPSMVKTFLVGHFWHQFLQWIVVEKLKFAEEEAVERRGEQSWGLVFEDCTKNCIGGHSEECMAWKVKGPKPWHWTTGSADVAPCVLPEHGEYIIDFKTMNSRDFNQDNPPKWVAAKWECQINIYFDFFDIDQGLMVGINKDSPHDLKEFEYRRNQPLIDAIYEKWELVSACIVGEVEPPDDFEIELPLQGHTL